jgi:BirA family transcriptional regulator, biotin operon repressor / biotin---[acetyl-CoA-carboxylase] ligase
MVARKLELLTKKKIAQYLTFANKTAVAAIEIFKQLSSTNDYLVELAKTKKITHKICFAEEQTAGKGRMGKTWFSPYARNIYFSVLWSLPKTDRGLKGFSLAIAVAIAEALQNYGIKEGVGLKWPNDVLWYKQKLAGILIEIPEETKDVFFVVIGVGLNLDMPTNADKEISQAWTDLAHIIKTTPPRNKIAGFLLDSILTAIKVFARDGLMPFIPGWQKLDIAYGKEVKIISATGNVSGISKGINEQGCLLVEDHVKTLHVINSGEVSLRF